MSPAIHTTPYYTFRGQPAEVRSLAFTPDSRCLLSGDEDGHIVVWDLLAKRPVLKRACHQAPVLSLHALAGDRTVISQGRDHCYKLWTLATDRPSPYAPCVATLTLQASYPADGLNFCQIAVRTMPDCSSYQIAALADSSTHKINVRTFKFGGYPASSFDLTTDADLGLCMSIQFVTLPQSPGGQSHLEGSPVQLLTGHEGGYIVLWQSDGATTTRVWSIPAFKEPIICMATDALCQAAYIGSADNRLAVIDLRTDSFGTALGERVTYSTPLPNPGIAAVAPLEAGRFVVTAGWDAQVRLFDVDDLSLQAVLVGHRQLVHALAVPNLSKSNPSDPVNEVEVGFDAFGPDLSRCVAAGSKDRTITLWLVS